MRIVIDISDEEYEDVKKVGGCYYDFGKAIYYGIPFTPTVLADMLMEERIRGKLDSDTTFEKDVIDDVKCRLTVSIRDHRPCYCGAELREVWRERKESEE